MCYGTGCCWSVQKVAEKTLQTSTHAPGCIILFNHFGSFKDRTSPPKHAVCQLQTLCDRDLGCGFPHVRLGLKAAPLRGKTGTISIIGDVVG
jgi:hypothetical protein